MEKSKTGFVEERRRFWAHHLEQCQRSGLSQAEYCRRQGLSIKSFGYRKRTIGKAPLSLVEIPLAAPLHTVSKPLSLSVGTRYTILIEPGFDAPTLCRLLEVIDR